MRPLGRRLAALEALLSPAKWNPVQIYRVIIGKDESGAWTRQETIVRHATGGPALVSLPDNGRDDA
jgi:hypothetical protein